MKMTNTYPHKLLFASIVLLVWFTLGAAAAVTQKSGLWRQRVTSAAPSPVKAQSASAPQLKPHLTEPALATADVAGTVMAGTAPLTGAVVIIVCIETGQIAQTETNAVGQFSFTASSGKSYYVTSGKPGFSVEPKGYNFTLAADTQFAFEATPSGETDIEPPKRVPCAKPPRPR